MNYTTTKRNISAPIKYRIFKLVSDPVQHSRRRLNFLARRAFLPLLRLPVAHDPAPRHAKILLPLGLAVALLCDEHAVLRVRWRELHSRQALAGELRAGEGGDCGRLEHDGAEGVRAVVAVVVRPRVDDGVRVVHGGAWRNGGGVRLGELCAGCERLPLGDLPLLHARLQVADEGLSNHLPLLVARVQPRKLCTSLPVFQHALRLIRVVQLLHRLRRASQRARDTQRSGTLVLTIKPRVVLLVREDHEEMRRDGRGDVIFRVIIETGGRGGRSVF
ncbi:hypothetical protein B0H19DRAFT_1129877 [Mycena capillaripes]|nr:hypothetical protein B0H19DRAFT_1129877 [Mycena capillaripes]